MVTKKLHRIKINQNVVIKYQLSLSYIVKRLL